MKVLIIAAHPDDEVLGCGATAAKLAQAGHQVTPVIICENATVRYNSKMKENLESWAQACANVLSIEEPIFLRLPDQKLDTFPALEMAQTIERVIGDFQPEVVFTHHGGDINSDHRVIFDATMVATRPLPDCGVKTVYAYETISSSEWGLTDYYSRFTPNVFFDVTKTLDLKVEAFGKYTSEVREYPHPRSSEGIRIRAKDWGTRVGMRAAEPFQLIRSLV